MQALGLIETKGLVPAIEGADAMLKAADVNLLEKTYVGGGLVSIAVTGDVGAVKAAVEAGRAAVNMINSTLLVSQHVIPRPHGDLDNIIVSAIPLKDRNDSTIDSERIELEDEIVVEAIEEEIEEAHAETPDEVNVNVEVDETVENLQDKEFLTEKKDASLQMDLSKPYNKKVVDEIVIKYGLEEAIKALSKLKVVELRNLARRYKNFGIKGRSISKADKKMLLKEFREYYGHN